MRSPDGWHNDAARRLRAITKRPVRIRPHPGGKPDPNAPTLEQDMQGAYAVVVWASSSGVKALISGLPVFYEAPHWIASPAARRGIEEIDRPLMDDAARRSAFESMAWAQWNLAEIASGEPFKALAAL